MWYTVSNNKGAKQMKLVIQTQYKENYGAHDWNGEGECPQYWKFKGGETYVVPNVDVNNLPNNIDDLKALICYSNECSEEYVLDWSFEDDDAKVCEEWETPWNIYKEDKGYYASRFVPADEYWKPGFKGKAESYLMLAEGERTEYQQEYIKEAA